MSYDMKSIRRIVVATDLAKASSRAASAAIELAKQNKAKLFAVHVLSFPTPYLGAGPGSPMLYDQLEKEARHHAESALASLAKKAEKAGVDTETAILTGPTDDRIVSFAKRKRADLIVVGTHGRTGVSKFFLGSVAARVISMASCPVLAVRGSGKG